MTTTNRLVLGPYSRRACLTRGSWLVAAGLLSGCGFHMRRKRPLPFITVQLVGFPPRSELGYQLQKAITETGTQVVSNLPEAEVQFRVLNEVREQIATATTPAAQVRGIAVRLRLRFKLVRVRDELVLIDDTELSQSRDLTYNETDALAKQLEAEFMFKAMEKDLVELVIRRLAAVDA